MKSFLAGLALGLAGAVAYSRSSAGRKQQRREAPAPRREVRPRSAGKPPSGTRQSASSPPPVEMPSRAAPPAPAPARNAEDILNSATRQQLLSVYGIGPVLADRIIQNRPYAAAYDVVEQGIIPESIFIQLRKQLLEPGA